MTLLTDGDISIFERGAILLHLGERSDALLPADPRGRMTPGRKHLDAFLDARLLHIEVRERVRPVLRQIDLA